MDSSALSRCHCVVIAASYHFVLRRLRSTKECSRVLAGDYTETRRDADTLYENAWAIVGSTATREVFLHADDRGKVRDGKLRHFPCRFLATPQAADTVQLRPPVPSSNPPAHPAAMGKVVLFAGKCFCKHPAVKFSAEHSPLFPRA